MADVGLRDLGSFVPGGRKDAPSPPAPRVEPVAVPPSVLVTPPPRPEPVRAIFAGDRSEGEDALGLEPTLAQLAQLVAHKGTAAPLCIALLGGPGSGKSFALARLGAHVRDLAAAAAAQTQGPFLSRIHLQTIDAASLEGDPALAIAARLHAGLRPPYPELAREVGATARDPHIVLREANEKLDETRRRLDSERRALDDAASRRARLTETVLYEASGSQVDAYARANRSALESRLNGFGLGGDPIRTYKDLVQLVAGSGGATGLALRAIWAFKGQTKLIALALLLLGAGVGLGLAIEDQATWLDWLHSQPKLAALADWAQVHVGLLGTARTAAFALAALALLANLLRALNFLRPIFKGARLLDSDLDVRRRDLDGLYAHQTKRVDSLESDVQRLTREIQEAERRAGGTGASVAHGPSPFDAEGGSAQAQTIFATLAAFMAESKIPAPQRIVLAVDHLEALPVERARAVLDALHRVSTGGLVTLVGADLGRLDPRGLRRAELERWIQVPVRLDGTAPARETYDALIRQAIGQNGAGQEGTGQNDVGRGKTSVDARRSTLDAPIDDAEAVRLVALADIAGRTPRAVKRFANLYSLARHGDAHPPGLLAFMLAVAQGGSDAERQAVGEAASGEAGAVFILPPGRLRDAFMQTVVPTTPGVTRGEATAALRRAAIFSVSPPAAA